MTRPVPPYDDPRTTLLAIRRMYRYAPWLCALHAMLWTVMNLTPLVPGLVAREIFDTLEGDGPVRPAMLGVGVIAALALARAGLWLAAGGTEIVMRFTMSGLVRRNVMASVLERPGAQALPGSTGEAIGRFRDDAHIVEDVLDWTNEIVMYGLIALGAFAVLLSIDARMAVVVTLPVVAVAIVAHRVSVRLVALREASSAASSEVTGIIGDIVSAALPLQAAVAEGRAIDHLSRRNTARREAMLRDRVTTSALGAVTTTVVGIGTGLVMLLGAGRLESGALTIGDFVLFVAYLALITDFADGLGKYLAQFRQAGVSLGRLRGLTGATTETITAHAPLHLRGPLPPVPTAPAGYDPLRVLEVTGLTCHLPGSGRGIAGVDLRLERGTLTVVTGPIGAGKTTLLRALLGLLPATGEIRWNGESVADASTHMVPPRAGYTPQVPRLFSGTLRENLLLGQPERADALADAIHRMDLEPDLAALPEGLDTPVGSRGVTLSGGQVQRVAAARMLLHGVDLLVIDDLSSALDAATERTVWDRLLADPDLTVLAVSHRPALIGRADQVIVLEAGRVVAAGPPARVLAGGALRDLLDAPDAHDDLDALI